MIYALTENLRRAFLSAYNIGYGLPGATHEQIEDVFVEQVFGISTEKLWESAPDFVQLRSKRD
jgi:hypothetical protein